MAWWAIFQASEHKSEGRSVQKVDSFSLLVSVCLSYQFALQCLQLYALRIVEWDLWRDATEFSISYLVPFPVWLHALKLIAFLGAKGAQLCAAVAIKLKEEAPIYRCRLPSQLMAQGWPLPRLLQTSRLSCRICPQLATCSNFHLMRQKSHYSKLLHRFAV